MTRFVRNPAGAVHSVPDDFEFPTGEPGPNGERKPIDGWEDVTEAEASPQLLGEPDPQVVKVELHELALSPVEETPSTAPVGTAPEAAPVEPAVEPDASAAPEVIVEGVAQ